MVEYLIDDLRELLNADPLQQNRKINTIFSKVILSKVLKGLGYTNTNIGKILNKSTHTIYHYLFYYKSIDLKEENEIVEFLIKKYKLK
jgi:hypothetical protein